MPNRVMLLMESRIHGNMYVRFGSGYLKTYRRKAARRWVSSSHNEEQDVKKKIMMVVGACIFLIAAAQALPLFFGIS